MKPEHQREIADAAFAGRQRSRWQEAKGNAIALTGIVFAFVVGGLFGAMAGWLFAVAAIGYGAYVSYRSKP